MEQFLAISFSFPTVVWSMLLAIVSVYWLLAIVGVLDLDFLDGDLDLDMDGSTEGLGGLAGFMLTFGLNGVPVTVVFSIIIALGWLCCYFMALLLMPLLPVGLLHWLAAVSAIPGSFFLAVIMTARVIRPMRNVFNNHTAQTNSELLGSICVVTTGSVTEQFGQAELADGGAGLLLQIRDNSSAFKKGDRIILIEYSERDHSYQIAHAD
ncbi:hypothetical protein EOPP23_07925 [Endozoicomonas sp. OPT23]|uniref:OB-fold-containig protein n=1 Tax=Endozoicomonas sp. OPT23 TaxID=2072845 RepID=UPI00129B223B|nr:OB-fold-containig protein [Endozoicomonas sp. OPT23]MRI32911.1 hypothetical protein [Endozoicomonas sp. OPT23]